MRLKTYEREIIIDTLNEIFGAAKVSLFGSTLDPAKKGGDIEGYSQHMIANVLGLVAADGERDHSQDREEECCQITTHMCCFPLRSALLYFYFCKRKVVQLYHFHPAISYSFKKKGIICLKKFFFTDNSKTTHFLFFPIFVSVG